MAMKFSVILGNLGSCSDRYMTGGYSEGFSVEQLLERLGRMKDIDGVELIGTWQLREDTMDLIRTEVKKLGLATVAIIPEHFGQPHWGKGAFTAPDPDVRKIAVEETNRVCEFARQLDCPTVSIWNGQDGYDYPMQADYQKAAGWLADGLREVASANPDVGIALEYKPKEPRNHCFIPNVWSAILLSQETGCSNVGVTIDVGHSFEAYENVSEAVCAAHSRGRLSHLHINDNNKLWDDDMMTGSVHTIEFIELFYWLQKLGYDGYVSIDQYPYREDSLAAAQESINWMRTFEQAAMRIDREKMDDILARNDAVASTRYLRELIFG